MARFFRAALVLLIGSSATASYMIWHDAHQHARAPAPSTDTPASVATESPNTAQPDDVVRVEIAATPAEAKIYLDDTAIPNPFRGHRPKDRAPHEVRVTAVGFAPKVTQVKLTQDLSTDIALTPAPRYVPKPVARPAPAAAKKTDRPPTVPTPAATTKPTGPGDVLQGPAKKADVQIDVINPWQ